MVLECYHYKYNSTVVPSNSCSGSFEECATLVNCNTEEYASKSVCFALAKPAKPGSSGNDTIILSSGCYPSVSQEACDKNCLGHQKQNGNYFCCCTENGCNKKLIPRPITTSPSNTTQPSYLKTTPLPEQQSNTLIYALSVIIICLVVVLGVYFKRSRRKRGDESIGRNEHSSNLRSYMADSRTNNGNNHPRELSDLRLSHDTASMIPFRDTFVDENNFHPGQQRNHNGINQHECNNSTSHAPRVNHINAINTTNNVSQHSQHSHQQQTQQHQQQHEQQQQQISPSVDPKKIKLLELVGSGRFGTVHKATLADEKIDDSESDSPGDGTPQEVTSSEIAVKIIPGNEYQSWRNELNIYNSPRTNHPNILKFLGSTENPDTSSYWLLVEYASNGSLHHYLKEKTVTWPEFLSISLGIVQGLSHLHDADIAHRDFKSKNVLLRHNLSPCITDFGVASMVNSSGGSQNEQRKKYLQVGTPRYMAPEVLECSVSFTKVSFIKIDVYALSLTLWELLSRCYPLPSTDKCDNSMVSMSNSQHRRNQINFQPTPNFYQAPHAIRASPRLPSKGQNHRSQLSNKTSTPISNSPINPDGDADHRCDDVKIGLLEPVDMVEPVGRDVIDCAASSFQSNLTTSTTNLAFSEMQSSNQQPPIQMNLEVPLYKMPFEDVVGPNPDISTMRQVVVSDRIRPPIKPEWNLHPQCKLSQAIVDGWEYDHDARISASCFVERIESLQKEYMDQLELQSKLPTATII